MRFLADFHIHSRYSRATSKELTLGKLHRAALRKGVTLVGTGDFTHPGWMAEIRSELRPAEDGFYRLKDELAREASQGLPPVCSGEVRFLLTTEISSIYKKGEQVRKVHNLIFAPNLEVAARVSARLERIGNLASDGRPILGLDSRRLLEIVLEVSQEAFLVPAHIWTPWFSVLGSRSGFDSLEECFEDLSSEIFALETGLSSDPSMNWRVSSLDRYVLVSNSDAHSPDKLGREANLFDCEVSYPSMRDALRRPDTGGFLGTVEFFPEQGKYHLDGHRKCQKRMEPRETLRRKGLCPVCGKRVTVGVMHRVEILADRLEGARPEGARPYERLVSLREIVGEALGVSPNAKKAAEPCERLIQRLGPELAILREIPLEEIKKTGGPLIAEGIQRMRSGEVRVEAGYDGEFGTIRIFEPEERRGLEGQAALLEDSKEKKKERHSKEKRSHDLEMDLNDDSEGLSFHDEAAGAIREEPGPIFTKKALSGWCKDLLERLNTEQQEAVRCVGLPLIIVAGPGTGKTLTLTCRIAHQIRDMGVPPEKILAVTFTNRAAREMADRLTVLLDDPKLVDAMAIRTFHSLGAELLCEWAPRLGMGQDVTILDTAGQELLVRYAFPSLSKREKDLLLEDISRSKRALVYPDQGEGAFNDRGFFAAYSRYEEVLREKEAVDFDDLVARTVVFMMSHEGFLRSILHRFASISVDEYQDVNQAQYRMLRLLTPGRPDLCVIGDPEQSIYGFRGADPGYFSRFRADYPGAKEIRLTRNYRSTGTILRASSKLVSPFATGDALVPDTLVPERELGQKGPRVQLFAASNEMSEAIFVAQRIERLMGGTLHLTMYSGQVDQHTGPVCGSFRDIAVLYRLGAQAPVFEQALEKQGIPYQRAGKAGAIKGREGRTLLAILRLLKKPEDWVSLEEVRAGHAAAPKGFLQTIKKLRTNSPPGKTSVERIVDGLWDSAFFPLDDEEWKRAYEVLVGHSLAYGDDLDRFLKDMALEGEAETIDPAAEKVTLATLHAAKGLEFPVVFLTGCEEQLLPCRVGKEPSDPHEERRLLYVGMTRAGRLLYLTWSRSRFLFGETVRGDPSPFLKSIPEDTCETVEPGQAKKKNRLPSDPQLTLF